MTDNKIQDIANEITAYKPYTAVSLIEKALKENNAPFPEEIVYYLKRVLQGYTSIASLTINNVTQKENKYIFDIRLNSNDTIFRNIMRNVVYF